MNSATSLFALMVSHLLEAAIRSAALALAAGLALNVFRVKDAGVRLSVWTGVLYAALAMPFLGWVVPPIRLSLLNVSAARPVEVLPTNGTESVGAPVPIRPAGAANVGTIQKTVAAPAESRTIPWRALATLIYLLVTATFLARFVLGLVLSRRLRRASHSITDPEALAALKRQVGAASTARLPGLAASEDVAVPVTLGFRRTIILIPAAWREWEMAKLRAVLAHELAHVARRDPRTQALSALHRCIFWFSPLSWWLDRHLAELAEQASDDSALRVVGDRSYYAEVLLGFIQDLERSPGRVHWQGASMAKGARTGQRLERILASTGGLSTGLKKSVQGALVLLAMPVLYLTAAVRPSMGGESQEPSAAPAPPKPPGHSLIAPSSPKEKGVTKPGAPPLEAPAPPARPAAAAPAGPRKLPAPSASSVHTFVSNGEDGAHRVAILSGGEGNVVFSRSPENDGEDFVIFSAGSTTMSGSSDDFDHAKALRSKIKGDFIWFRRDGKSYVIRDAATVIRAKEFFAPQEALGKKQEELGKLQEALGAKQEELGKKQQEVRVPLPDLMADIKKLEAEFADTSRLRTQEEIGELQSQLGEMMSKLGEQQGRAGEQQGKLGEQQGELGRQQAALGEQQAKLGREQARLAREAVAKMNQLLDSAPAKGLAEPEPR